MMKLSTVFWILLGLVFFVACQSSPSNSSASTKSDFMRAVGIDDRLYGIDSTVVVFYDQPYGPDSLRYTRFYTQTSLQGSFVQEILPAQFESVYTKSEKRNACRGEGKIWCYRGGAIMQTLYFSNQCDNNCCYVYFIKDGFFYYTRPLPAFRDALLVAKPYAKKPNQPVTED